MLQNVRCTLNAMPIFAQLKAANSPSKIVGNRILLIEKGCALVDDDGVVRAFTFTQDGSAHMYKLAPIESGFNPAVFITGFLGAFGLTKARGALHKAIPGGASIPIQIATFFATSVIGSAIVKSCADYLFSDSSVRWGYYDVQSEALTYLDRITM